MSLNLQNIRLIGKYTEGNGNYTQEAKSIVVTPGQNTELFL